MGQSFQGKLVKNKIMQIWYNINIPPYKSTAIINSEPLFIHPGMVNWLEINRICYSDLHEILR
jgi:hypothetical protein